MNSLPHWFWLVNFFALGACIGSFLNVVVWRSPRGKSLVSPPSACPGCNHRLAALDNIPVLGWILLRGRCRYCKMAISPEYPAVEAYTGILFAGMYILYYMTPWRPAFAEAGLTESWPLFAVHLILAAALVSVTLVDTAFAIIPLCIPNFVAGAALLVLPAAAAFGLLPQSGELVREPVAFGVSSAGGLLAVAGALLMLGLANLLLRLGLLPHSFEGEIFEGDFQFPESKPWTLKTVLKTAVITWCLVCAVVLVVGWAKGDWPAAIRVGVAVALPLGLAALAVITARSMPDLPTSDAALPPLSNPRKVAWREALFVLFPLAGAAGGVLLAQVWTFDGAALPVALHAAAGVAAGYLVGAGMTWMVRILGTLAFRKEAMGLGDVHLMGAVGAVLGPIAAVGIFLMLAPFMGLLGALGLFCLGKFRSTTQTSLAFPYGPYLALGTLVVMGIGLSIPDAVVAAGVGKILAFLGVEPMNEGGILATLHTLTRQLAH